MTNLAVKNMIINIIDLGVFQYFFYHCMSGKNLTSFHKLKFFFLELGIHVKMIQSINIKGKEKKYIYFWITKTS